MDISQNKGVFFSTPRYSETPHIFPQVHPQKYSMHERRFKPLPVAWVLNQRKLKSAQGMNV